MARRKINERARRKINKQVKAQSQETQVKMETPNELTPEAFRIGQDFASLIQTRKKVSSFRYKSQTVSIGSGYTLIQHGGCQFPS
jgi:hypothetical protein